VTTLREEILDLLQAEQLLHEALQRILAWLELALLLERTLRLRQASTSRLSRRWRQHRSARIGLFGQQLSLQLLRLIMRYRHQLR